MGRTPPAGAPAGAKDLEGLLALVALGDEEAFAELSGRSRPRCSGWSAGCGRLRWAGPTSCGWSAGRGLGRAGGRGRRGRVTRLLDGRVTGDEQVAMTVERRGGTARPTSEPVVVVDLRA